MNTENIRHALSYFKEETLKLSLFLIVLYGLVFAILRDPAQGQAISSVSSVRSKAFNINEEIVLVFPESEKNRVEIPALGVTAPLLAVNSTSPQDFTEPLKKGTTLFPSALPGQKGTAVILGHSAPLGWPHINYDWVFSDIQKLQQGDKITITFGNKEYAYSVTKTFFLQKGQEIPATYLAENESHILLISCWPPGIDNKRIGVYAELTN